MEVAFLEIIVTQGSGLGPDGVLREQEHGSAGSSGCLCSRTRWWLGAWPAWFATPVQATSNYSVQPVFWCRNLNLHNMCDRDTANLPDLQWC